ncbi:hypothetical protein ACTWP5_22805 [Streptomyces sp. 4N509B]|uniref:hypothetical protein n=1 Tax=Streptomyces sp. 4N509B TaxID=3457413 RepID=UPI003FD0FAD9
MTLSGVGMGDVAAAQGRTEPPPARERGRRRQEQAEETVQPVRAGRRTRDRASGRRSPAQP